MNNYFSPGGAAPVGANVNEIEPLTIQVACEGEGCNARLEVIINLVELRNQESRPPGVLWSP
jgi:hypothetical protein